ncbi:JmjC domain-containing protein [Kitasatospora sp. NPDC056138]|uniref:JmjC domain-containing protein n=1 Tax=Kitasatospora sp. NPDC056138 TaxID=3345724 RepID=UPI0035DF004C
MTSREVLPSLVGDVSDFYAKHWRTAPAVFRPREREQAPDSTGPIGSPSPISLREVDDAIDSGLLRVPYVEMVRKSTPIDAGDYTKARTVNNVLAEGFADAEGIRRMMDDGVTLLLRNVEHWHMATREAATLLERQLGHRVEAFLFATPPGEQGLPVHRDDADVLLVQIQGGKRWKVYDGPRNTAWSPGRAGNVGPALLAEVVREGEVLYIPRGYAHEAVGEQDELSVHLSFTIREVGRSELYSALERLLLDGMSLNHRPRTEQELLDDAEHLLDRFRAGADRLTAADVLAEARRAEAIGGEPARSALARRTGGTPS